MAFSYGNNDDNLAQDANRMYRHEALWRYGTTDPLKIQQKIQEQQDVSDFYRMQDQRIAQTQALREAEAVKTQAMEERKRLGLGTFDEKLNDTSSDMYQWAPAPEGTAPVEIDVGGTDGSAPTGISPLRQAARRRVIKPEYKEAFDQQRTNNSEKQISTTSPYENPTRQREADTKELDTLLGALEMMDEDDPLLPELKRRVKVIMDKRAAQGVNPTSVASINPTPQASPVAQAAPKEPVQVDVAMNDQIVKSDPTGTLIKRGNAFIFRNKDGVEKDVTARVNQ